MRHRVRPVVLLCAVAGTVALAACGAKTNSSSSNATSAAAKGGKQGGSLTVVLNSGYDGAWPAGLDSVTNTNGAANALVKRYAKRGGPGAGTPGSYTVSFAGIDSGDDYIRLSALLQKIAVVRAFRPGRAAPGTLEVQLDLSTGLAGFRRLAGDALLPGEDGGDGAPPVYRLR